MRTQRTMGTWKKPVEMQEIASKIDNALYWEDVNEKARQAYEVEHNEVPQYTSPTGNPLETKLGRVIHARTYGRNPSWDERGQQTQAYGEELKKADEKRQQDLQKGWKSREEEMEKIADRLSIL